MAVIATNAEWSLEVSAGFQKHFKAIAGEVTATIEASPEELDFRTILQKVLKTNPDVIYGPVNNDPNAFFKQLHSLNSTITIVTSDILNPDLINEDLKLYEGVYQSMVIDPANSELDKAKIAYKEYFKKPLTLPLYVGWGMDAVNLFLLARENNAQDLAAGLYKIKNFVRVSANISISQGGSSPMYVCIVQVRNGKFEIIKR